MVKKTEKPTSTRADSTGWGTDLTGTTAPVPPESPTDADNAQWGTTPAEDTAPSTPANSQKDKPTVLTGNKQLVSLVERIERLEEEKKAIAEDVKEVYSEAKGEGYDTKILRMAIRLRKMDRSARLQQESILDSYLHALGMIPDVDDE